MTGPLQRIIVALEPFAPPDLLQGLRDIAGGASEYVEVYSERIDPATVHILKRFQGRA